jgi:molecular chaperone GrpE
MNDELSPPPSAPTPESATEPAPAPGAPAEISAREADLQDQLLRLRADFDNFRRRNARERQEWTQRSLENILGDLINSLDHFEIGLATAEKNGAAASVLEGFRLVQGHLDGVVRKYGLERIDAAGAVFDPRWHEALQTVPSAEVPAHSVALQVRPGYRLGERVLRAAQVIVSGGPPAPAADTPPAEAN